MNGRDQTGHPEAERLQALLDDALDPRERRQVEEHVRACRRCASELEAWSLVFQELDALPTLRPHEGFAARVLQGVRVPEPRPLPARAWDRVRAWAGSSATGHPEAEILQDLADGALPGRRARDVARHLETCASCRTEAEAWTGLVRGLGRLPRHAPGEGFADAVMAQVRVPAEATAPVPARSFVPALAAASLRLARGMVPRSRRAWAALSGAAVTPAVTVALVLWTVFSSSTLTPSALASFVWWQLGDLAASMWARLSGAVAGTAGTTGLEAAWSALASAPLAIAALAAVYTVLVALALRVLVRNLFLAPAANRKHA